MARAQSAVQRVKLHKSGPEFSRVVWGTMRAEEQFRTPEELADHLRFLLDRGVTTIDTANTYGAPYTTEEFLGKALKLVGREKFEIITKCGIRRVSPLRPDNRIRHYDYTETELRPSVERSLQKLGIDHVDLLLLHRPDYLMDPDETAGVLEAFVAEGKTRHVGVSNFSVSRHDLLASRLKLPIVTNQIEFSPIYIAPISNGTLDLAIRVGHRPMVWSPVGGGQLLAGTDEKTVRIRKTLAGIAKRNGFAGPAEAAIAFVARHPAGGLPIIGSGKRERMDAAIAAVAVPLDRQDWYDIAAIHSAMLEL